VNISEEKSIKDPKEIPEEMKNATDFLIDAGVLNNPPSSVIDLTSEEPRILRE